MSGWRSDAKLNRAFPGSEQLSQPEACWQLFSDGRLLTRRSLVRHLVANYESDWLSLLEAELRSRAGDPDFLSTIADVVASVAADGDHPDQVLWSRAILADHLMWHGALELNEYASLDQVADLEPDSVLGAVARLRIARAHLFVRLLNQPPIAGGAEVDALEQAGEALYALGAKEEAATTAAAIANASVWRAQPRVVAMIPDVLASYDELAALGSDHLAAAAMAVLLAGHLAEDAGLVAKFGEMLLDQEGVTASDRALVALLVAEAEMRDLPSKTSVDTAESAYFDLARRFPQLWTLVAEAANLLDYGRTEPAVDAGETSESVPLMPWTNEGLLALRLRLQLRKGAERGEGERVDGGEREGTDRGEVVAQLQNLANKYLDNGAEGQAAVLAQRTILDLRTLGVTGLDEELLALVWEIRRDSEPSPKEARLWGMMMNPQTALDRGDRISMLESQVRVLRHGRPVSVGELGSKLLVLLLARDGMGAIEQLIAQLWPDLADERVARRRFNLLVHRLRQSLELGPDELLVRERYALRVNPTGWQIDVQEFREKVKADYSSTDWLDAWDLYRDNLCSRQFPYDEAVAEIRDEYQSLWCDLAIRLLRSGALGPQDVAARAELFGIDLPKLRSALTEAY